MKGKDDERSNNKSSYIPATGEFLDNGRLENGKKDKFTDLLARVLQTSNGKDPCIAICMVDDKLLIANNSGKCPDLLKENLYSLQNLVDNKFYEQKFTLVPNGLIDILKGKLNDSENKLDANIRDNLEEVIANKQFYNNFDDNPKQFIEKNFKQDCAKVQEFLQPLIDLHDIKKEMQTSSQEKINIMAGIAKGDVYFIEGSPNIHAEIKIRDFVFAKNNTGFKDPNENAFKPINLFDKEKEYTQEKNTKLDIGISKLCCIECHASLDKKKEIIEVKVTGTHGKLYDESKNWKSVLDTEGIGKEAKEAIKNNAYTVDIGDTTYIRAKNTVKDTSATSMFYQGNKIDGVKKEYDKVLTSKSKNVHDYDEERKEMDDSTQKIHNKEDDIPKTKDEVQKFNGIAMKIKDEVPCNENLSNMRDNINEYVNGAKIGFSETKNEDRRKFLIGFAKKMNEFTEQITDFAEGTNKLTDTDIGVLYGMRDSIKSKFDKTKEFCEAFYPKVEQKKDSSKVPSADSIMKALQKSAITTQSGTTKPISTPNNSKKPPDKSAHI